MAENKGIEHIKKCSVSQLKQVLIEYELHIEEPASLISEDK